MGQFFAGPLICVGVIQATSYAVRHPDKVVDIINGYFKQAPNPKNTSEIIGNIAKRIMDTF